MNAYTLEYYANMETTSMGVKLFKTLMEVMLSMSNHHSLVTVSTLH